MNSRNSHLHKLTLLLVYSDKKVTFKELLEIHFSTIDFSTIS